ncbi:MAG: hypothetical protein NTW19_07435 [Planctomycetota bacterium]|nr:hypothetical protein [Planctomycetota bacterium]
MAKSKRSKTRQSAPQSPAKPAPSPLKRGRAPRGDGWRAGFAQGDITPPKGHTLMSGYGRERYAVGALAPLLAQALALADKSGNVAVLVTADILGFDRMTVGAIREAVAQRHGLAPESIMLAASHTHWSAGTLFKVNFATGALNPFYVRRLEEEMLRLVDQALADLAPARVAFQAIQTRIGRNRRLPQADGSIGFAINRDGHYDTHTPILRVSRAARGQSPSEVVLVGHACHPTSSGGIDKWTPDYPGGLRREIERSLGPDSRAMFVMGCGADAKVVHVDPKTGAEAFTADPKRSRQAGQALARAALKAMAKGEMTELPATLSMGSAAGGLTLEKPRPRADMVKLALSPDAYFNDRWWARQSLAYSDARKAMEYEIQAWRLGGKLTMFSLEGETVSDLGPLTRSFADTRDAMIVGYANVMEGYIPTKKVRIEGGYEGESSHRAYCLPAPFTTKVEREFKTIAAKAVKAAGKG